MEKRTKEGWAKKKEYTKNNFARTSVTFHKVNEADLIEHLSKQANKPQYIKSLIRADMEKHENN